MTRSWFRFGVYKAALGAAVAVALTFGLVIGCTTAPGSKSGAQGPGATNFPNPLMNVLTKIVTEDIPKQPELAVKYSLLSNALANLDFKGAGKTTVNHLANEKDYEQTTGSQPKYFGDAFKNNHITVQEVDTEKGRYDYLKAGETWVDFAAINLGGGAFHNGFAQEETMTLEMPELANVVAEGGNFTRTKGCDPKNKKDGPLVCSPTPLFIGPVHRTIAIKPGLGGDAWKTTPVSKALGFITPVDKNLELNVLAVAVANLADGPTGQEAAQPTIDDLFNTFVAAFTLAKDRGVGTLNTGSIGTGVFANSTTVVYVVQKLAAMQVGINLRYYGVDKKTPQKDLDAKVTKIVDAYTNSQTHSMKHLLELAHDILK